MTTRPLEATIVALERLTDELDGRIRTADRAILAATIDTVRQAERDALEVTTRLDAVLTALADARPAIVRGATRLALHADNADAEVLDNLADLIAELRPEVLEA